MSLLKPESSYKDETFKSLDVIKDLKKSEFDHVIFQTCHFIQSDWQDTYFSDCKFKNCNLSLVNLKAARLQNVIFEECKIVGLDFYKCGKTLHLSFNKSILQTCNFTDLKLKGTSFAGAKLREVYFTSTDLSEANFTDSDLSGTTFHQCNLSKADFRNAINYMIDLQTNTIKKAKFSLPEAVNLLRFFDIDLSG